MVGGGSLPDGVYYLWNNALNRKERLDLNNGDWDYGTIQVWEANKTDNSNANRNQRWLITKVPEENGDGEYYHISNLFYGCLAGAFESEPNLAKNNRSHWVKGAPSTSSAKQTQWGFSDLGNGNYSIYIRPVYGGDQHLRLDLVESSHHGQVLVWQQNSGENQKWFLEEDPLSSKSHPRASWMSNLPDRVRLINLNLVGTHQSLAVHGKNSEGHEGEENFGTSNPLDSPRCQNRSPYEQMIAGVRSFDLRLIPFNGNFYGPPSLYSWHGPYYAGTGGYTFTAFLQSVKLFLENYRTETIIVTCNNPCDTVVSKEAFQNAFKNDFTPFEKYFVKRNEVEKPTFNEIWLKEVAGKAILVSGWLDLEKFDMAFDQHSFFSWYSSKGQYDVAYDQIHQNVINCKKNITDAVKDIDISHSYGTDWNMSNLFSYPPYNPSTAFSYAKNGINEIYQPEIIGKNQGGIRIGLSSFDFYEQIETAIGNIIRSNLGCGDVP